MQLEPLDTKAWRTKQELADAIFEWIECWRNPRRSYSSIGMHSTVTFESLQTGQTKITGPTREVSVVRGEPHSVRGAATSPSAPVQHETDPSRSEPATAHDRLLTLLPPATPMPTPGGWAASADLLLYLVDTIRQHRPTRVIELGSGTSTCWLAWALDVFTVSGTVVSLEHLPDFRSRTLQHLHACGVQHRADVRLAPLTDIHLNDTTYPWYDPAAWNDLRDCDLLLIDGPPGKTAPMARYPAVPLLRPALRPGASVVLDDYNRPDEREIVTQWHRLHPDWGLQILEHEKGTAVLVVPGSSQSSMEFA